MDRLNLEYNHISRSDENEIRIYRKPTLQKNIYFIHIFEIKDAVNNAYFQTMFKSVLSITNDSSI